MRRTWVVLGVIAVGVALIVGGVVTGLALARGERGIRSAGRGILGGAWGDVPCGGAQQGYGMMGGNWGNARCAGTQPGYGMMGRGMLGGPAGACVAAAGADQSPIASLQQAQSAVERYLQKQGYTNLTVGEVMEFERNYYAIVAEKDSGTGAMELLIDKSTGAVGPEMGPNMMWNARYGMMGRSGMMGRGRMMGGYPTGEMTLSTEQAAQAAQDWLDANMPGRTAGEGDAFYGYYTFHFLKDGEIDGMLSVNGSTGAVWYHSWHGAFVAGTEGD